MKKRGHNVYIGGIIGKLEKLRKQNNITQFGIAKELSVNRETYQRWARGIIEYAREENFQKVKNLIEKYEADK